jgi:hypothetical protein
MDHSDPRDVRFKFWETSLLRPDLNGTTVESKIFEITANFTLILNNLILSSPFSIARIAI